MKKQIYIVVSLIVCMTLCLGAGVQVASAAEKLVLWDIRTADPHKSEMNKIATDFMKANPGVEIELVHLESSALKTKLKIAMGAGTPPDIFHNWGGGPLKEYIDAGMVAPIDAIKDQLLERYIPASFDPVTFDGKTYGVAYESLAGVYFFYRKDLFTQSNLDVPTTWDDLLAACETLKQNGIIPIAFGNKNRWPGSFFYMYLADRLGGSDLFLNALYRKNNVTFEDPVFVKTGKLMQELAERGFFPKGFNGIDRAAVRPMFYTGKAAMYLMGSWFVRTIKAEAPDQVEHLGFFPFPVIEGGKGDPSNLIGSPGQGYLSVASTCQNKELAMKFLNEHIMTPSYVEFLYEAGEIPPVKGAAANIEDPILKEVAASFEKAAHVQAYYDQFMAPALGEKHKDIVQALFGLSMTPEEAANAHEAALLDELQKQ